MQPFDQFAAAQQVCGTTESTSNSTPEWQSPTPQHGTVNDITARMPALLVVEHIRHKAPQRPWSACCPRLPNLACAVAQPVPMLPQEIHIGVQALQNRIHLLV